LVAVAVLVLIVALIGAVPDREAVYGTPAAWIVSAPGNALATTDTKPTAAS
jgi:hypothetical protein